MKKLTMFMMDRARHGASKWAYVTIPDGYTLQVIPARTIHGLQVRVYKGSGKLRELAALFYVEEILDDAVAIDFNHPLNDRAAIVETFHNQGIRAQF